VTHAALLHQLASGEACQLTETIGAVDYGIERLDLSIPQDKVTVCKEETREGNRSKTQERGSEIEHKEK